MQNASYRPLIVCAPFTGGKDYCQLVVILLIVHFFRIGERDVESRPGRFLRLIGDYRSCDYSVGSLEIDLCIMKFWLKKNSDFNPDQRLTESLFK